MIGSRLEMPPSTSPPRRAFRSRPFVEILDTTLRDGEQAEGVSMAPAEKLTIARRLLEKVQVDRIEIASGRTSDGEGSAVRRIADWAEGLGLADRVEVLGFVDMQASVDWTRSLGGRVINLLTKGSLKHCREQLRTTPQQHLDDIRRTVDYGVRHGMTFNVYLEDWSSGMRDSPEYVRNHVAALAGMPVERLMLCDTLGILSPAEVRTFVGRMTSEFPSCRFDYHGHNDYGLATANTLEAALGGVQGVHCTVNGLGERAGTPRSTRSW